VFRMIESGTEGGGSCVRPVPQIGNDSAEVQIRCFTCPCTFRALKLRAWKTWWEMCWEQIAVSRLGLALLDGTCADDESSKIFLLYRERFTIWEGHGYALVSCQNRSFKLEQGDKRPRATKPRTRCLGMDGLSNGTASLLKDDWKAKMD